LKDQNQIYTIDFLIFIFHNLSINLNQSESGVKMYGLVNKAVKGLVLEQFGEETWEKIRQTAQAPDDFVAMQGYDDSLTYRLVGAAVEVLGVPAEQILHAFGEYWVLKTAAIHYADMMNSTGSNLFVFLQNLDAMHSRIKVSMPDLNPPSFRVKSLGEGLLQVDYFSSRDGLLPFVVGLIHGLSKHFEQAVEIEHVDPKLNPLPSKRMKIKYQVKA
jgi:hypothetical protein